MLFLILCFLLYAGIAFWKQERWSPKEGRVGKLAIAFLVALIFCIVLFIIQVKASTFFWILAPIIAGIILVFPKQKKGF